MFLRTITKITLTLCFLVASVSLANAQSNCWRRYQATDRGTLSAVSGPFGPNYSVDRELNRSLAGKEAELKDEIYDDPFRRGYRAIRKNIGTRVEVGRTPTPGGAVILWEAPYTIVYNYDAYICN